MSIEAMKQALEALEYYLNEKSNWKYAAVVTITSLRQSIAEAEKQEPKAWRYSFTHSSAIGHGDHDIGPLVTDKKDVAFGVGCFGQEPLYTHPQPKREPLTDEQTNKAAMKLAECMDYPWTHMPEEGKREMRKHAKAVIEAAHGIKE
jgi:hypothetical protein